MERRLVEKTLGSRNLQSNPSLMELTSESAHGTNSMAPGNQKSSEKPDKILRNFYPQEHIDQLFFLPVTRGTVLKVICDSFSTTVTENQRKER